MCKTHVLHMYKSVLCKTTLCKTCKILVRTWVCHNIFSTFKFILFIFNFKEVTNIKSYVLYFIHINDLLSSSQKKLLFEAKEIAKIHKFEFVWILNCQIFVRKLPGLTPFCIRSFEDLDNIVEALICRPQAAVGSSYTTRTQED